MRFLSSLKIPVVAVLRDSQCFVNAAGRGLGIAEMPNYQARKDKETFATLLSWLNQWQPVAVIEKPPMPNIIVEEHGIKPVH